MRFRESAWQADNGIVTSDSRALEAAAFRLKHDLGKAIRWSAPSVREADSEELRSRLRKDLLETRVGPDGRARSAVEVFEGWLSQEGALFSSAPSSSARLVRMSEAIEDIRRRLPRLPELGWNDLVALDEASLLLQKETSALWRESISAKSDDPQP
jgi:hypothetical protein